MEIKTKFNHGQRVQAIMYAEEGYNEVCPVCEGKGTFEFKGRTIDCSEEGCYGKGFIRKYKEKQWFVPDEAYFNFVVQRIGVELYNPNNKKYKDQRSWIYYMADSSGSMFDENNLFASVEEAEAECLKRNNQ